MGEYSEVFVAFDVAKKKHAVAIAEGGRRSEIRFVGEIENSPATIERMIKKLAGRYECLHVCFDAGPTRYAAEIGDVHRVEAPRQLMSFLGLVPAESSTGDTVKRVIPPQSAKRG